MKLLLKYEKLHFKTINPINKNHKEEEKVCNF